MNPDSVQEASCSVLKTDYETSKEIDMTKKVGSGLAYSEPASEALRKSSLGTFGVIESGPSTHQVSKPGLASEAALAKLGLCDNVEANSLVMTWVKRLQS